MTNADDQMLRAALLLEMRRHEPWPPRRHAFPVGLLDTLTWPELMQLRDVALKAANNGDTAPFDAIDNECRRRRPIPTSAVPDEWLIYVLVYAGIIIGAGGMVYAAITGR